MIAALLFYATSSQGSIRTIDLSRGAVIQPANSSIKPFTYWDTSDTFIDGADADDNFGGEPVLSAGPTKTVLIRFGDLRRAMAGTPHIRKASLILTIAGGDKPSLRSIARVIPYWNAGPYFSINALINRSLNAKAEAKKISPDRPGPPRWSATWKAAVAGQGGSPWQQAGANGPEDSEPIAKAAATAGEKLLTIDGLAEAVQNMADAGDRNNGFALHFQNDCEFFSSRAVTGRPMLELELEPEPPATGPDLSVVSIQQTPANGAPKEGEDVGYVAHIKNVGTEKSGGFSAVWYVNSKAGATLDVTAALDPGAETTLTTHVPYHLDRTDHRTDTVELAIKLAGKDASKANNSLTVYQNGKQIDVILPAVLEKSAAPNLVGSHAVEDWVQEQFRIFNNVYAAQSRFSFAPDGAKERVSVHRIQFGDVKPADAGLADGTLTVDANESDWYGADPGVLRSIGLAAGLPDFTNANFPDGVRIHLKDGGSAVTRGTVDMFPGVVGYGDTRYEGSLPGAVPLQYEPFTQSNSSLLPLVPSGLLSATDVQVMNSRLDRRDEPLVMPRTTLLKATDLAGRPLGNVHLDFYQSSGGQIVDGPPAFSATTSENEGTVLLPNRDGASPFGKVEMNGGNGAFLIKATSNGASAWSWLKAWQVADAASRGNALADILEVHFNLTSGPLDTSVDLARDRLVTDSTNLLPAKIAPLISGSVDREVTLGGKAGDWVEVDLGRDRTIGEISLVGDIGKFWSKFDILVYATGQKPDEATAWAKEADWRWTSANRRNPIAGSPSVSVSYCAPAARFRFIRIVNRSDSTGILRAIRVTPIKISQVSQ
ncbi:MAG: CARDB domain-containing protein [Fimbriimonas sp.]|nr:CARDB domain-containing protein [Fimbriimonas sp.]